MHTLKRLPNDSETRITVLFSRKGKTRNKTTFHALTTHTISVWKLMVIQSLTFQSWASNQPMNEFILDRHQRRDKRRGTFIHFRRLFPCKDTLKGMEKRDKRKKNIEWKAVLTFLSSCCVLLVVIVVLVTIVFSFSSLGFLSADSCLRRCPSSWLTCYCSRLRCRLLQSRISSLAIRCSHLLMHRSHFTQVLLHELVWINDDKKQFFCSYGFLFSRKQTRKDAAIPKITSRQQTLVRKSRVSVRYCCCL